MSIGNCSGFAMLPHRDYILSWPAGFSVRLLLMANKKSIVDRCIFYPSASFHVLKGGLAGIDILKCLAIFVGTVQGHVRAFRWSQLFVFVFRPNLHFLRQTAKSRKTIRTFRSRGGSLSIQPVRLRTRLPTPAAHL